MLETSEHNLYNLLLHCVKNSTTSGFRASRPSVIRDGSKAVASVTSPCIVSDSSLVKSCSKGVAYRYLVCSFSEEVLIKESNIARTKDSQVVRLADLCQAVFHCRKSYFTRRLHMRLQTVVGLEIQVPFKRTTPSFWHIREPILLRTCRI